MATLFKQMPKIVHSDDAFSKPSKPLFRSAPVPDAAMSELAQALELAGAVEPKPNPRSRTGVAPVSDFE
jgi:hypothetical protein